MARAVWCARVTIYHEVSRRSLERHDVMLAAQRSSFAELGGVSHANMSTIQLKIRRIEVLHPHFMLLPNLTGIGKCPILGILDITKNSSHLVDHIPNGWVM